MNNEFWKNQIVMITGHEGFLGSWLTKTLVDAGVKVVGIDKVTDRPCSILTDMRVKYTTLHGNIADGDYIKDIINLYQPTVIFHLAAEAIVGTALLDPIGCFKDNMEGTWNIMESVRHCPSVKSVVVASSDKAYGSHEHLPYKEDFPLQGLHPYDMSKSCTDLICQTYHHTYNVPVSITRCGNIYGPGDHHFSRIIPDAIRHLLRGDEFVIRSDGQFTRDYIYVEDIVNGYISLAEQLQEKQLAGEAFNFSDEKPLSVIDVYNQISQIICGKVVPPKILNQAKYEIKDQYLESSKARDVLGWSAQYSIEQGLTRAVEWYQQWMKTTSEEKLTIS